MAMRTCKNCKQMEKVENMTFICENYFCLKCKNDGAVKELFKILKKIQ